MNQNRRISESEFLFDASQVSRNKSKGQFILSHHFFLHIDVRFIYHPLLENHVLPASLLLNNA